MNKLRLKSAGEFAEGHSLSLLSSSIPSGPLRDKKQQFQLPSLSYPEELYSSTFIQMLEPKSQEGEGWTGDEEDKKYLKAFLQEPLVTLRLRPAVV